MNSWLSYQWERDTPCILADDMGLGKTLQIISFLNYLLTTFGIYPFLIVVPKSTATNWIREFSKWAPNMVVAPYHGPKASRDLSRQYEIFRGNSTSITCHAVVLTYESALSDINVFKKVEFWPVLVVDEAQRLKSDTSLLYEKLNTLQKGHIVLMTGMTERLST